MAQQSSDKITPRHEDYNRWYQDVVRQGQLAEVAEVVKGCMVIRPHGYAIWEKVQSALDKAFKKTGVSNAYFPLLIPESFMKKEAEHVEGFAPELAVVTHAGGKKLEENYVIRPTSETIIGHYFSRWIESYRDLPLLINQWCNVMRWELRTRIFLRTSEFLWQEGHTAHATHAEAQEEVRRMLEVYKTFCETHMAMPVVCGTKSDSERFAGAVETQCIEAYMQDGKALQAGTSHDLGQNFGRAFDVKFQTAQGGTDYVWQTSWGSSTRFIGALIMTHSDDRGLVLPPRMAPVQVVIIPILGKNADAEAVVQKGTALCQELMDAGLSVVFDNSDHKPGYKYFTWEQKGVPLRIELGPRDMAAQQVMVKDRLAEGPDGKQAWPMEGLAERVKAHLEAMQQTLYDRALKRRQDNTVQVDSYEDFIKLFEGQKSQFVLAHWDGTAATEAKIKEETRATLRCIPFDGDTTPGKCMVTGAPSKQRVLFAKAY